LTPLYLYLLGPESYGLVAFFLSFRAVIEMMDLGLRSATMRQVASRANQASTRNSVGTLVRTVEVVYWCGGILLAVMIAIVFPVFGSTWFKLRQLSTETVELGWLIFSATLAATWPTPLYRGVLHGLERQVTYNVALVAVTTVRGLGALIVLVYVSQTVLAFFVWQLIAGIFEVILLGVLTWFVLRQDGFTEQTRFDIRELRSIWGFIAEVSLISVMSIATAQADKLLIGLLMPLEQLGYYNLAATLAASLERIKSPIINAVWPRLTASYAQGNAMALINILQQSSRLLGLVVAPVGIGLACFSYEVLAVWTRSIDLASNLYPVLSLLALASLFNAMTHLDSNLQFAVGRTRFLLMYGVVSSLFYFPACYFAITTWGLLGAAGCWLALNILSFVSLAIFRLACILKVPVSLMSLFGNMHIVVTSALLFAMARGLSMAENIGPVATLIVAGCIGGSYLLWSLHRFQSAGFLELSVSSRSDA
jgi:O-antigen/teichoic acid export membrane protein